MYRKIIEDLRKWKTSRTRKPLILQGARQTGKTWIMKEFGRLDYKMQLIFSVRKTLLWKIFLMPLLKKNVS